MGCLEETAFTLGIDDWVGDQQVGLGVGPGVPEVCVPGMLGKWEVNWMIQCGQNLSSDHDGHLHPRGWNVAVMVSKELMIPPTPPLASWSPCSLEWEAPEACGHAPWLLNS